MRVIVAGSTTWKNADAIRERLKSLPAETAVVVGDAPGADEMGGEIAAQLDLAVEPMVKNSEDHERFQKLAWKGLNERMLATGIDLVLAFHPDVDQSTGTKHLIELADAAGIPVEVITQ
ncbi:MAG: hypothetical protein AAFU85_28405 [Planctomycetota bacterium]